MSLELLVTDEEAPTYKRALAWVILIMVWGAMRCDDVQSVLPGRMMLSNYGLKLVLGKSKTTGPDKPQKEVMVHILRTVSLTGVDWLGTGYDIWDNDPYKYKRDYLVMLPNADWTKPRRKFATSSMLSMLMGRLLSQLNVPRKRGTDWDTSGPFLLLPDGLESYFTGHSPRNFLTSVAAVLGFSKDMRAYLGRWAMGMTSSEEYIRTSRQVVYKIQKSVNQSIVEGRDEQYFEGEAIDALCEEAERMGANPGRIKKRHTTMNNLSGRYCLGGLYPTMVVQDDDWFVLQEAEADDVAALQEKVVALPKPPQEGDKDAAYEYFVTISRRTSSHWMLCETCQLLRSQIDEPGHFGGI